MSNSNNVKLSFELRPATPKDFKYKDTDGTERYKYGRMFYVQESDKTFSSHIFSALSTAKKYFTEKYTAGLVWVPVEMRFPEGVYEVS